MGHHSKASMLESNNSTPSSMRTYNQHHHNHRSRTSKTNSSLPLSSDPSIHSISSGTSDISSEASSAIHKRSTPKIAAVIIAAIIVTTALIAVTVYLVNSEKIAKLEEKEERANNVTDQMTNPDTSVDFQTYYDETAKLLKNHQGVEDVSPSDGIRNHPHLQPYDTPFHKGQDPEGPTRPEDTAPIATKKDNPVVVDGEGKDLATRFWKKHEETIKTDGDEDGDIFGNQDFTYEEQDYKTGDDDYDDYIIRRTYQSDRPFGARLDSVKSHNPMLNIYNMEPYRNNRVGSPVTSMPPRIRRPPWPRDYQEDTNTDGTEEDEDMNEQIATRRNDEGQNLSLPPNGSRGGIHVPLSTNNRDDGSRSQASSMIATLDRRPGRPVFHHLGPNVPQRPSQRRMNKFAIINRRRQQQKMINRRLGLANLDLPRPPRKRINPIQEAKEILANFDSIVAIAKSEADMLRDIARNLTEEGKPINLREMLKLINETIRSNPDSAISRLMNRFYNTYLMEEEMEANEADPARRYYYENSISSLLFLSFGIFLLNSVNGIIAKRGLYDEAARSFDGNPAVKSSLEFEKILQKHPELKAIFESEHDSVNGEQRGILESVVSAKSVNSFVKLLMNLMKVYNGDDESELQCVWSLYCHQLNKQAKVEGAISTMARINSVGVRVIANEVTPSAAIPKVIGSMINWEDLQCNKMFPKCNNEIQSEEGVTSTPEPIEAS